MDDVLEWQKKYYSRHISGNSVMGKVPSANAEEEAGEPGAAKSNSATICTRAVPLMLVID